MPVGMPSLDVPLAAAIVSIVLINVVLSGDNALVIGLAARGLPMALRGRAIALGAVAAIVLRVVFTLVAGYVLMVPMVEMAGGVALIYIAHKLLRPTALPSVDVSVEPASIWDAIQTIVLADVLMSLDNVIAIGGASHGDFALLLIGLGLSVPLIVAGGGLVAWLLDAVPGLVYVGSGVLAWTAGSMIVDDQAVHSVMPVGAHVDWIVPIVVTACVLAVGLAQRRRLRRKLRP